MQLREEVQTLRRALDAEKEKAAKIGERAEQFQSRTVEVERELERVKSESSRRANRLKDLLRSELLANE